MLISREQYLDYMAGRSVERPLFVELFGPLVGLAEEWRAQGASEDEIGMKAFGFDYVRRFRPCVTTFIIGDCVGKAIEDTPEYSIRRDTYGRRVKLIKSAATIAHPLDYPVTDMESWLRIKHWYEFREERLSNDWLDEARNPKYRDLLTVVGIPGGFDEPRQLLGEENLCVAYHEQPEMIHDMLDTIGQMAERVLDRVSREIQVDVLSVHEDLAGRSGPLAGPKQVEEFIKPYYRRIWDMLQSRGAQFFQQDSDGDLRPVMQSFLDAGLNCMYPMEPAAGMDIVEMRRLYGKGLMMMGGIDKHVLRQDKEAIRRELEYKLQPGMQTGGIVFGLDHRIPNGTPLENYRYYVKTARELLGLDPNPAPCWGRMAF